MRRGPTEIERIRRGATALLVFALAFLAIAGYIAWSSFASSTARVRTTREHHARTTWAACNRNSRNSKPSTFTPLSDAKAASLVTPQPENRHYNATAYTIADIHYAAANDYLPDANELRRFRRSRTSTGQPVLQFNPYARYVDGRDGLRNPSTDELIQWVAHKWGIPEDWLRAEFVQESYWNQFQLGDEAQVSSSWYGQYPIQARVPNSRMVYQSLGITQSKWIPDGSVGAGTEPLRWESTAFNLDYQAAIVRFYYDNPRGARSSWGDRTYAACEQWSSIGGWFEPYPWGNGGQQNYVAEIRRHLANRDWTVSSFVHWKPSSFPPGVRFQ